jgi:hypothetical protein
VTRTTIALVIVAVVAVSVTARAQQVGAAICIAPIPIEPYTTSAPGLACPSGKLSMRIDNGPSREWPRGHSEKLESLDIDRVHRVAIACDGKAQQSFKFKFSEFKSRQLCLFINDLYGAAQLWESNRSPWCKCK